MASPSWGERYRSVTSLTGKSQSIAIICCCEGTRWTCSVSSKVPAAPGFATKPAEHAADEHDAAAHAGAGAGAPTVLDAGCASATVSGWVPLRVVAGDTVGVSSQLLSLGPELSLGPGIINSAIKESSEGDVSKAAGSWLLLPAA